MWSRRHFLESLSALPMVRGFAAAGAVPAAAVPAAAAPARKGTRDFFKELGVRPFINAAGTYTSLTASIMPPSVQAAVARAAESPVRLVELQKSAGEYLARKLA